MVEKTLQIKNRCFTLTGDSITASTVGEGQSWFSGLLRSNGVAEKSKIAVVSDRGPDLIGAAASIFSMDLEGILLPTDRWTADLESQLRDRGFKIFQTLAPGNGFCTLEPTVEQPGEARLISVLTSGSTGQPKLISHRFEDLVTLPATKDRPKRNWILTYSVGSYAWYQMIMLHLFTESQHLVTHEGTDPLALWEAAFDSKADACSSTPSFWRFLMLQLSREKLCRVPLRQITLGGEPVDPFILDDLSALFPEANITHIYATTELGVCIVVNDGKAGFPVAWLTPDEKSKERPHPCGLKIKDHVLWVNRSEGHPSTAWVETGDLVEIKGDRVFICGRRDSGFINVGGRKVFIHQVENILLAHPDIIWCRVFPEKSHLLGQMVAVDLVIRKNKSVSESSLAQFCRKQGLPDWMVPRFWYFQDEPKLGANFKSVLKVKGISNE